MAILSVQIIPLIGLEPSYAAADVGGDEFVNSGRDFIHVKNGHTSEQTVTMNSQTACSFGFDHDAAVAIPASEERMIGPFPKNRFDDSNGKVLITYSGVTSLTIAVLRVP
jgi:hypothetical protein